MQVNDIKTALIRFLSEEAAKRAEGAHPEKADGSQTASAAPDALDIACLTDIDVVTISNGLKAALDAVLAQEGSGRAGLSEKEIMGLIKALVKDKNAGNSAKPDALLKLEAADIDLVTISRELKSVLRSSAPKTGETRQIEVSHDPGSALFLNSIIIELLPGLRLRLLKIYKRKSRYSRRKEGDEGGRKGNQGQGHENKRQYAASKVRFASEGTVEGDDGSEQGYRFELNLLPEGGLNGGGIALSQLAVRYTGKAEELHDFRFAFEIEPGDDAGQDRLKGKGYGLFMIDLVEISSTGDGAPVYGIEEEDWVKEV